MQLESLTDGYLEWLAQAADYDHPPVFDPTEVWPTIPYAIINAYGLHCKFICFRPREST